NGCADTLVVNRAVHTKPPVASYNTIYSCENKSLIQFEDLSILPKTWYWTFGDGTSSTERNPKHTFPGPGTYSVVLTVTNGNCTSSIYNPITVVEEKATFIADSVTCRNTPIKFESTNLDSANVSNWTWDFGDGKTADHSSSVYHSFDLPGIYTVTHTITDIKGCTDVYSQQVKVYGPVADFTPSVGALCLLNNSVTFTDGSYGDGKHLIIKRLWDYGDGTIDSLSPVPYQHHYDNAGSYNVSLTVTDDMGCTDKITKTAAVIVAQPKADFITTDTASCTSKNIGFTNNSSGIAPAYEWNFGDGTQSLIQHPTHNYLNIGTYSISLKITDQYGCSDSITKSNYISISYPKAEFTMSDTFSSCPPLIVDFKNHSTDYSSSRWDFGDGNFSTLNNPSHFYNAPGIYFPKLTVTGPGGCSEMFTSRVEVKGPNGTLTYQTVDGCTPLTVKFTASTQNTSSFIWDFSDGTTLSTTDSVVTHTYSSPGEFIPKMILIDPSGCNYPIFGKDTIKVYSATASFEVSSNNICDNGNIQFRNTSISNDLISDNLWNFGDGSSSNLMEPLHHYNSLGAYSVKLVITTVHGCKDSVSLSDVIRVLESPIVSITGDSASCVPAAFNFQGRILKGNPTTMSWNWNLANGNTYNGPIPNVQNYTTAGNYVITAIVTSENGCKDTATRDIILHALPHINAGADMFICRGSVAQLKATGGVSYIWNNNSLSCTTCPSPLAAPVDSTLYVVKGFTEFRCSSSDSVVVRVHQPFDLSVQKGDTICVGESVELRAYGTDVFSWSPSASVTEPNKGLTTARPTVSTTYQVIAKDKYNCFADTAEVIVKVWSLPTVSAGVDQNIVVGNSTNLKSVYSNDVISWQWNNGGSLSCFNCPSPVATPKQTTNYTLQVKNGGGCAATDQVSVFVTCNNGNLFIPNTFSPNADGVNDRFYPNGKGINMIRSLRVFNRWGEIVFERSNFSPNEISLGWDGSFKGQPLAPDVYVYTCDVLCQNNEVLTYKGDVTLLR
ncbi:MAG: PKD domain-containing protein, partial [Flavisolibacter sp.]